MLACPAMVRQTLPRFLPAALQRPTRPSKVDPIRRLLTILATRLVRIGRIGMTFTGSEIVVTIVI